MVSPHQHPHSGVMEVMHLAKYKNIQAPKCVSHVVLKMLELI